MKLIKPIKVVFMVFKKRGRAKKFFNRNYKKFKIDSNTLVITENPDYKILNPLKPFRGKNPKYISRLVNREFWFKNKKPDFNNLNFNK